MSAVLTYARKTKVVIHNVCQDSTPPKEDAGKPPRKVWTAGETRKFLKSVEVESDFPLWRFYAVTGVRRGEGLGLRWQDLDFERGEAWIRQEVVRGEDTTVIKDPKSAARSRYAIPLDRRTLEILEQHRLNQLIERGELGDDYQDFDLVFPDLDGTPKHPDQVYHRFKRLVKRAGLPSIRLHDLRHGIGQRGLDEQINPELVRRRLGHANIGVTLGRYSQAPSDSERDAAETLVAGLD